MSMRFFIALEIPPESRSELQILQGKLKSLIPEIRLTDNQKLHLTIAFIGEQSEDLKRNLVDVITKATTDIKPFMVIPAYIDAFPRLHNPHTFWVGVKGDLDKLFVLEERIKDGLIGLNLEVDNRRYLPHIAIGKVVDYKMTIEIEEDLEEFMLNHNFSPIQISSIKLFESVPSETFHQHNTLAEIAL